MLAQHINTLTTTTINIHCLRSNRRFIWDHETVVALREQKKTKIAIKKGDGRASRFLLKADILLTQYSFHLFAPFSHFFSVSAVNRPKRNNQFLVLVAAKAENDLTPGTQVCSNVQTHVNTCH